MKEIIWDEYLKREDLRTCSADTINELEEEIGYELPEQLKNMMMSHGGQSPTNLIPKYPNGKDMAIECIYHAYSDDDEYDSYTIPDSLSCLADEDYINLVPFSDRGNVFLVLDCNKRVEDPPVAFLFRDFPPNDPRCLHQIADNFDEFLEKYTQ